MTSAETLRRHREAFGAALAAIDETFGALPASSDPGNFDRLVEEAVRRNKAKREADARALWREARTPELRAHLRLLHPDLFEGAAAPRQPGSRRFASLQMYNELQSPARRRGPNE